MPAGTTDITRAADALGERLPPPLKPLARVAYNLRWSWTPGGPELFSALDPDRWLRVNRNPIRLLTNPIGLHAEPTGAAEDLAALSAPADVPERPIAFMCAEFGIHQSMPIYSGGLGVLAGDIVKEASDLRIPMVAVGLLYRTGYFHQRLDTSGMQHEYWTEADPTDLPCVLVTHDDGSPVTVTVPIGDEDVVVQVWRCDVGRVPLFLLDTDRPDNSTTARWITSRLYEGSREIRLAQYAVLGLGGIRALRNMGIAPSVLHLNEGHPALATLERPEGCRVVFTTHTPVPAGNETYPREQVAAVLGRIIEPPDDGEFSMTALALANSDVANGVSRRHGEVARAMWNAPIGHVTNGVHVATWLAPPMRALLDRHLGDDWLARADDPDTWIAVDKIPDEELWAARNEMRAALVEMVRERVSEDRLRRGDDVAYTRAAARDLDANHLTIGFARRLATYKRVFLFARRAERVLALTGSDRPVQFLFAGKAHPLDEEAKWLLLDLFALKHRTETPGRVAYLEDYDMSFACDLVAGCDVWVNTPRPPQEASGTSGMKACLDGALNVSVLDGWWAEAYDGTNGWAIDGDTDDDHRAQDERHADALFDILERDVVPLFHDRDEAGIPRGWLAMVRNSLKTNGPRFSATRMVKEYASRIYVP